MKTFPPPSGYISITLPTGSAWVLPWAKKSLIASWQKLNPSLPLRLAARRHPLSGLFRGRAPVVSFPCPGLGSIVVRPCVHGGQWGRLAQDLYFGPSRALREVVCSQYLHEKKIPTTEILAVLFYPAGCLLRIDVVTSAIPDSRDFVSFLSSRPKKMEMKSALRAIRALFSKLEQNGILHPDLNARNILLAPKAKGPWQAWLLDVDAVRFETPNNTFVASANRSRLLRSLFKRAQLGDLGMTESSVKILWQELFP
jgi:3-deoxy-D-manno-octulosonic acid kinase